MCSGRTYKNKNKMKQSGLSNRFSQETRHVWDYWFSCMICGMNQQDALHHIISPSSSHYVAGKHNESVLNSCPIHNMLHPNASSMEKEGQSGFGITRTCHVGNETYLYDEQNIYMILWKVRDALKEMDYQWKPIDEQFLKVYGYIYDAE